MGSLILLKLEFQSRCRDSDIRERRRDISSANLGLFQSRCRDSDIRESFLHAVPFPPKLPVSVPLPGFRYSRAKSENSGDHPSFSFSPVAGIQIFARGQPGKPIEGA